MPQTSQGRRVTSVTRDMWVRLVLPAQPATPARARLAPLRIVSVAQPDVSVIPARLVQKVLQVLQVLQVRRALMVPPACSASCAVQLVT